LIGSQGLILVLFLAILGCSPAVESDEFYHEASRRGCTVVPHAVYFVDLPNSTAGFCMPAVGIFINSTLWGRYDTWERRELIFHEHGHCSLGLGHEEDGIMSTDMHDTITIRANWQVWLDILFLGCV